MKHSVYLFACILFTATLSANAAQPGNSTVAATPAQIEQIYLADRLAAYGIAQNDPLLVLAAAKLMQQRSSDAPQSAATALNIEQTLAEAERLANGRPDIIAMIEDMRAEGKRGLPADVYCFRPPCFDDNPEPLY